MIRTLLSRFRRKPVTRQTGIAAVDAAVKSTLGDGLEGFVIAVLHEKGSDDIELLSASRGDIEDGLRRVLEDLLTDKQTHAATKNAMLAALLAQGGARVVQVAPAMGCDDPDCPVCSSRREMDGSGKQNVTTH